MRAGHIALSVSDLKRTIAFYKRHFGVRCAKKYVHRDIGLVIALLKKGDMTLELFEFKRHKPLPQYRKTLDSDLRTLGFKHFCFETRSIEAAYNKFKKKKVKLATGLRVFDSGKRYFFVKDPDGNLVELMEQGRSPKEAE